MQRELPVCLTRTQGLQLCQPQETGYLYVGPADVLRAIWKSLPSELLLIGGGGGVGGMEWAWEVKEGLGLSSTGFSVTRVPSTSFWPCQALKPQSL